MDSAKKYENLSDDMKKFIKEEEFNQLNKICTGELEKIDIVVEKMTKQERKQVHDICKTFQLNSNTLNNAAGEKIIQVNKAFKKTQSRSGIVHGERGRSKEEKFLHFSLYKENIGTTELISQLAHSLRTKDRYFTFAGTKDRRGRTLQRIAVSLVKPETIEKIINRMRCEALIGNYTYHPQGLRMGDLAGNHFEMAIKDINADETVVNEIMMHFKEHGFINYFGMQRFGTSEIPTHKIGLKVLQKDLQGALDLILEPKNTQYPEIKEALEVYAKTKDANKALSGLSNRFRNRIEAKLLNGLSSHHENDKTSALKFIPTSVKQMYGHAYQSYIWNYTVSKRLDKYGTEVLEGDLVQVDGDTKTGGRISVRKLNGDEVGKYNIYDIFIPLPGHESMMPENQTKDFILETLKVDGLDLSDFKNPVRDFDLPGGYRKMLTQGKDVSWELVKHKDVSDDLIHSRLELFQAGDNKDSLRKIGDADGSMTSLLLRMSLDTSCYATMALREIMRVQTDIRSLKYGDEEEKAEELENQDSENTGGDDSIDDAADNSNGVNGEAKRKLEQTGDIHTKKTKIAE